MLMHQGLGLGATPSLHCTNLATPLSAGIAALIYNSCIASNDKQLYRAASMPIISIPPAHTLPNKTSNRPAGQTNPCCGEAHLVIEAVHMKALVEKVRLG